MDGTKRIKVVRHLSRHIYLYQSSNEKLLSIVYNVTIYYYCMKSNRGLFCSYLFKHVTKKYIIEICEK